MSEWPGRLRFSPSRWRALYWPRCCADYPRRQKRRQSESPFCRWGAKFLPVSTRLRCRPMAGNWRSHPAARCGFGGSTKSLPDRSPVPRVPRRPSGHQTGGSSAILRAADCTRSPLPAVRRLPICDAEFVPAGATWNRDDVILFAMISGPADQRPNTMPVQRVPASGGKPQSISTPDEQSGEVWHVWPDFLPDGRHFLYFATGPRDPKGIYLGSIDSPDTRLLVQGGSNARYANGQLFYLRATTLFAQPFDADALELRGEPVQVAEHVRIGGATGVTGVFTVSSRGVLVYQTGENVPRLAWFDPSGRSVPFGEPRSYNNVSLSPNNARASVTFVDPVAGARDIWLVDTVNGSPTRFTFHAADENTAIWSPDGLRIVFNSNRGGHFDLYKSHRTSPGPRRCCLPTIPRSTRCHGLRMAGTCCFNPRAVAKTAASISGCCRCSATGNLFDFFKEPRSTGTRSSRRMDAGSRTQWPV